MARYHVLVLVVVVLVLVVVAALAGGGRLVIVDIVQCYTCYNYVMMFNRMQYCTSRLILYIEFFVPNCQ